MGALLAAIPAIAGGTLTAAQATAAVSTAATIGKVASAGFSIVSGLSSMAQSNRQAEASQLQARQLELQGRLDAIKVNDELMKTLSMNEVATAASGLKSAGTAQYAQQQSMQNANEELRIQQMNTAVRKSEAVANAQAQKSQGLFGLADSAMTAGDRIGSAYSTKKKTVG